MIRVVVLFLLLLAFSGVEPAQVFDHTSSFNQAMASKYQELCKLPKGEVVSSFLQCCKNAGSLDATIKRELDSIVCNGAGRETLLVVTARLLPYVECANSLEKLLVAIPPDEQLTPSDELNKAELVSLFFETFKVQGRSSVAGCINSIRTLLDSLRDSPVKFPEPVGVGVSALSRVFSGYSGRKTKPASRINKCWNKSVYGVVSKFLPILREGMFELQLGSTTRYEYKQAGKCAQIYLSSTKPVITARCITGPLLCNKVEGVDVPVCYQMTDRRICADSGLHHEVFHHLVIGLELDENPHFADLIMFLIKNKIDGLYVSKLKEIYTDMDEFRNIIGLFTLKGNVYFDSCSEAAYLCAAGVEMRGTHKSDFGTIKYAPISFVELLKSLVRGFQIDESLSQNSLKRLRWC